MKILLSLVTVVMMLPVLIVIAIAFGPAALVIAALVGTALVVVGAEGFVKSHSRGTLR
jgi:hypothetical protein